MEETYFWEIRCGDCGRGSAGTGVNHRDCWAQQDSWKQDHIREHHPRRSKSADEYEYRERVVFPGAAAYEEYAAMREAA